MSGFSQLNQILLNLFDILNVFFS